MVVLAVLGFGSAILGAVSAGAAEEAAMIDFLDGKIEPMKGLYLMTADTNVRELPRAQSKRIGGLDKGSRVEIAGKASGPWYGVLKGGRPFGFIYAPSLIPVVDGTLAKPLEGRIEASGAACDYRIGYVGRTPMSDEGATAADYEVDLDCRYKGHRLGLAGLMFLTEAPYRLDENPEFQINLDLPELNSGPDTVLSVTCIYNRPKGRVSFSGTTIDDLAVKPAPDNLAAKGTAQALEGALKLGLAAWTPKAWDTLAEVGGEAGN